MNKVISGTLVPGLVESYPTASRQKRDFGYIVLRQTRSSGPGRVFVPSNVKCISWGGILLEAAMKGSTHGIRFGRRLYYIPQPTADCFSTSRC